MNKYLQRIIDYDYTKLFSIIIILQILDVITTLYARNIMGDNFIELNEIIRPLLEYHPMLFIGGKLYVSILAIYVIYSIDKYCKDLPIKNIMCNIISATLYTITIIYTVVIINNFYTLLNYIFGGV